MSEVTFCSDGDLEVFLSRGNLGEHIVEVCYRAVLSFLKVRERISELTLRYACQNDRIW